MGRRARAAGRAGERSIYQSGPTNQWGLLWESPASAAAHSHQGAAACWEGALIWWIDQDKDKTVASPFRWEGKRREEAPVSQSHQRSAQTHLTYSQAVKGLSC